MVQQANCWNIQPQQYIMGNGTLWNILLWNESWWRQQEKWTGYELEHGEVIVADIRQNWCNYQTHEVDCFVDNKAVINGPMWCSALSGQEKWLIGKWGMVVRSKTSFANWANICQIMTWFSFTFAAVSCTLSNYHDTLIFIWVHSHQWHMIQL